MERQDDTKTGKSVERKPSTERTPGDTKEDQFQGMWKEEWGENPDQERW